MNQENSGNVFCFKLDHNLGYGFAEVYDFTDVRPVDGMFVFTYNRIDAAPTKSYKQAEITSSGIALGPIVLLNHPNVRGVGAWKYLFKTDSFIMEDLPVQKSAQDLHPLTYNWNELKRWHRSDWDRKKGPDYVPYPDVRNLETSIINSTTGVVKKATMKKLIDDGIKVLDYYDLTEIGNLNMFTQLINTYYPLDVAEKLIKDIPPNSYRR